MSEVAEIRKKQSYVSRLEREIASLIRDEKKIRERWTDNYHKYLSKNAWYRALKNVTTKKALRLRDWLDKWENEITADLTKKRDDKRAQIKEKQEQLAATRHDLEMMLLQVQSEQNANDEIVDTIFSLNATIVHAIEQRDAFTSAHVYERLVDDKGNLRRQFTIDSSDGKRRVVALVNSITKVKPELAEEALFEIDRFYDRFRSDFDMNPQAKAFLALTSQILIQRKAFKVGPDLYKFLGMEIPDVFPELKKAQQLLGQSLRSEKTDSYVRLYRRASATDKWKPVPKS